MNDTPAGYSSGINPEYANQRPNWHKTKAPSDNGHAKRSRYSCRGGLENSRGLAFERLVEDENEDNHRDAETPTTQRYSAARRKRAFGE